MSKITTIHMTRSMRWERVLFAVVSLCLLIWNVRGGRLSIVGLGLACAGAQRVLEGQVPYRDFWTLYAPGSYYLLAGIFKVTGSSILVAKITSALLTWAAVLFLFEIARRLTPVIPAWLVGLASAVVLYSKAHEYGTYPTVLPCVLAALWCTLRYFESGRRGWLFVAGVSVSAAMLFKHDVGAYVALSIGLTLVLRRFAGGEATLKGDLTMFAVGCCVLTLPVYLPLMIVAGRDMVTDLIVFPLTDFPIARPEHYPEPILNWAAMTTPLRAVEQISMRLTYTIPTVVFLLSSAWLIRERRRLDEPRVATLLLLTLCLPFFWQAAHVQINTHIFTMTLLCAVLVAAHLWASWERGARWKPVIIAAICVFAWLPRPIFELMSRSDPTRLFTLPRAAGIHAESGAVDTIEAAVRYVHERTRVDEAVYVGLTRHDAVLISAPLIGFLLERPLTTRYHELHPLINDTRVVQREMIGDLRRGDVRYLILWRALNPEAQDRFSARRRQELPRAYCDELDAFILERYVPAARFGKYEVWRHRGAQ